MPVARRAMDSPPHSPGVTIFGRDRGVKAWVIAIGLLLLGKSILVRIHPLLEWVPVAIAVILLLLLMAETALRGRLRMDPLFGLYIWFIVFSAAIFLSFNPGLITVLAILIGSFTLLSFLLLWVLAYNVDEDLTLSWVLELNVKVSVVIALLGLYQFFIDPTLFGTVGSIYARAGMNPDFTRRAVSIFGTPQVLGIYMAVTVAYLITRAKTPLVWAILALNTAVMFMSGSKSVFVFFVAFVLFHVRNVPWARIALFGILISVGVVLTYDRLPLVQRVLEPIDFLLDRRMDSRVFIWLSFITDTETVQDFVLGHGIGTAERVLSNRFGFGLGTSESYLLKLYYEIGVAGLLFFLLLYGSAMYRARERYPLMLPILAGFATNLVVVHAYAGLFLNFFMSAILARCLVTRGPIVEESEMETLRSGRLGSAMGPAASQTLEHA